MEIYFGKEVPKLEKSRFSVLLAESNTGIILTIEGKRYFEGSEEPHILLFDSFEDAEGFSKLKVKELPDIECNIYDSSAIHIETIT